MISNETLTKLKKLCEQATDGDWIVFENHENHKRWIRVGSKNSKHAFPFQNVVFVVEQAYPGEEDRRNANAAFIAESRTAIPALIQEIERLEEVRKAAQMVWDAGMITVNEMVDHYRAKALGEALEKAKELRK